MIEALDAFIAEWAMDSWPIDKLLTVITAFVFEFFLWQRRGIRFTSIGDLIDILLIEKILKMHSLEILLLFFSHLTCIALDHFESKSTDQYTEQNVSWT